MSKLNPELFVGQFQGFIYEVDFTYFLQNNTFSSLKHATNKNKTISCLPPAEEEGGAEV